MEKAHVDRICVRGQTPLRGRVTVSGSKNAALAIMAASLLVDGKVTLHNVPRIGDVHTMMELLTDLGATAQFTDQTTVTIDASQVLSLEAPYEVVRKMRASFNVMGPLLTRLGFARVPVPGGCDIGARPVNFHIEGLKKLGASLHSEHGIYTAEARRLVGANIYMDFQSAGATQHLMTAAALADGVTVIENCAAEPEVVDLASFLNSLGAQIEGAGTTTITVTGVRRLQGGEHTIIPDRLEAGTFAVAGAITQGDILIEGAIVEHMRPVVNKLEEAGILVTPTDVALRVAAAGRPKAVDIKTNPHPAFPTDLQQPFAALLSIADGTSVITENVYESRFRYVNELNRMGANIRVSARSAVITGVDRLTGCPVAATDLRAGAALICAALAAEGSTELVGSEHIDRGYEDLVGKLRGLGASIQRCEWIEK
ncbi:MAG: UDP-N-acetylglucosamine 1-carboxyvinyltransferase [Chthonomonadales bacterium]|nr:UDP-N-acetylglucosamine 1-carboxyvinyltransferase [Chthonomonadales bacterium]